MGIVTNSDGFFYDPDVLNSSAQRYWDAAAVIDGVLGNPPHAVDAGASSGAVGKALGQLIKLAAAGSLSARDTSSKVHATTGAYGDVEDTNASTFKGKAGPR